MGDLHHPTSTRNPQAQKFFNQGLTLLYGFNYPEAAHSFREAVRLDPGYAMGWWGLAMALGPNINEPHFPQNVIPAFEASRKAAELASTASPREKAYIEALQARYVREPGADRSALDKAFAAKMKSLAAQYPDDLDAQTLYAESLMMLHPWRLWTADGKPAPDTLEIVRLLEYVLDRNPDHMGACHYYIHAVEASTEPWKALPAADRLGKLAPAAGHLVHMPAHIYMRTGDYERAAVSNREASEADRLYFQKSGAGGIYGSYYAHNLHFLSAARSMQGRYAEAISGVEDAARIIEPLTAQVPIFEPFLAFPILVNVRFRKWDKIMAMPQPPERLITSNNLWRFGRGMAFASNGKPKQAQEELTAFRASINKVPDDRVYGQNPERLVMNIAAKILEAKIAQVAGNKEVMLAALNEAVRLEDSLQYNEPADWYYPPSREALGAGLISAGKFQEAEAVFREDLRRNRRNGRSLFGLMEALKAQGRHEEAALVKMQLDAAWKGADEPLQLSHLF